MSGVASPCRGEDVDDLGRYNGAIENLLDREFAVGVLDFPAPSADFTSAARTV